MRALDTAATGMAAMDLQVQVIAGNIANMSTCLLYTSRCV